MQEVAAASFTRERERSMVGFFVLPEECISNILSLTSPKDACKSSLVSSTFKSAAESDVLWQKFLPEDYNEIISRLVSPSSLVFPSKKELYLSLCDHPILIDGGNKSFALEKWSGKKCFMIGARELSIIWGDTPEYWRWISLPESRFEEAAELLLVCWLEIHGRIETRILSPKTTYACYLVLKFVEGAFGFESQPVEVSVGFVQGGGGGDGSRIVYLDPDGSSRHQQLLQRRVGSSSRMFRLLALVSASPQKPWFPQERRDGWMEIEMGEFFNDSGEDGEVQMNLLEVKILNEKGGFIIQGIEIRPKENQSIVDS